MKLNGKKILHKGDELGMKTCYACGGPIKKVVGPVMLEGITVNDIVYEECQQCREQYFDEKTSIFIQDVVQYVKRQRKRLRLEQST